MVADVADLIRFGSGNFWWQNFWCGVDHQIADVFSCLFNTFESRTDPRTSTKKSFSLELSCGMTKTPGQLLFMITAAWTVTGRNFKFQFPSKLYRFMMIYGHGPLKKTGMDRSAIRTYGTSELRIKGLIRTYWEGILNWPDISTTYHSWVWIKGMDHIEMYESCTCGLTWPPMPDSPVKGCFNAPPTPRSALSYEPRVAIAGYVQPAGYLMFDACK